MPPRNVPDRNLALELVRVTEAAALAAARHVGRGDKEAADQAAVDGMHGVLHTIHLDGIVVIGEGEKDEAPMLANGEQVGDGSSPQVDIAVDPLEGTRLCALGMPVELVAERRGTDVTDVMVVVLDRPRHEEGIKAIRDAGARVRLITDGDVSAALMAVSEDSPVDLLWGIGGTPEGVLAASGIKAIGG